MNKIKHFNKYVFLIALIGFLAIFTGCKAKTNVPIRAITLSTIEGVSVPVWEATPVDSITETTQYTGTVTWDPTDSPFDALKVYKATITLTPKKGYTLEGVAKDFFTVADATTATNLINSGEIIAFFPETKATRTSVNLKAAGNYVILAKTTVTNTGATDITGDLGLSPAATSFYTGFALTNATGYATSVEYVTGKLYASNMAPPTPINLTTAVADMITAYNDAAGRALPKETNLNLGNGLIGGATPLTSGLYKWASAVTINSDLTLNGSADDVWIFQIDNQLSLANGINVSLTGGATWDNVFWQVAEGVTLGTTSHMEGTILSLTYIDLQNGSSINGRLLAQTAVTLNTATIVAPQVL